MTRAPTVGAWLLAVACWSGPSGSSTPAPVVPQRDAPPRPPRATLAGRLWITQGGEVRRLDAATRVVDGVSVCPGTGRPLDAHPTAGLLAACDGEGGAALVTFRGEAAAPLGGELRGVRDGAWHPGGGWALVTVGEGAAARLWRVAPDQAPTPWGPAEAPAWSASFRPDGAAVAFVLGAGDDADVVVTDTAGQEPRPLAPAPGPDAAPRWSVDGANVAFLTARAGGTRAWVATADGASAVSLLPPNDGVHGAVRWGPDGLHVAVDEDRAGKRVIRVASLKGGRGLRTSQRADTTPTWSPDGRWVAFDRVGAAGPEVWAIEVPEGLEVKLAEGASVGVWEPLPVGP